MTSRKEMEKINHLLRIIQREERISRIRLVMASGISNSYYEKLKPFLEEIHFDKVHYDKETKVWHVLKENEIKNTETSQSDTAEIIG